MKKLVKESLSQHNPWDNDLMEKMLDEFEQKVRSLDETEWEQIQDIKRALWLGYTFKNPESKWEEVPAGPRGDMDPESWGDPPDWRPREMGQ